MSRKTYGSDGRCYDVSPEGVVRCAESVSVSNKMNANTCTASADDDEYEWAGATRITARTTGGE